MLKSLLRTWVRGSVLRKGASGQSTFWAVVGAIGVLRTLHRRYGGRQPVTLMRSKIRPGEVIEVKYTGEPSSDLRKERAKRAELVNVYNSTPDGRKGRKLRKQFANTVVAEDARSKR